MSLPSQSSRNATRSSQVHYRRSSGGPMKKIVTAIVVIAVVFLVWYTLIRPQANKLNADSNANEQQNSALDNSSNLNEDANQPIVINNAPESNNRPLPGAGTRPDPSQEIDRVLDQRNPNQIDSTIANNSNATNPNSTDDILSAAAEQANRQSRDNPRTTPQEQSTSSGSPAGIRLQLDSARRLIAENNRVQARKLLSQTLLNANISSSEAQYLRDELTMINNQLLFSPVVDPKDRMCETYKIQSGDSLSKIASRRELATHWKLIARINQIADPSKIRLGQNLKLVRGPFHAVVHKSEHRLDLFHGSPNNPESWLYIRSFDVGLGSNDGTPIGDFVVSANKLENPGWVNPRDAKEQYLADDPANPIGEYWIGLTGVGQYASLTSLGIHGTIDQDSIGGNQSMGCVRLAKGDIDTVFEFLAEHISRVLIKP
ncbi:MAG: LysM peptidoglycan-binding domain-containing protein [Phycisphaerales bacterium]|nr:LysM peptidoglycan-binding domain-containing protein [Phycisphaerales bacterium]